jgi:hypothetical protein
MSVNGEGNKMVKRNITFDMVVNYVKQMELENDVAVALINKARIIPPGTWGHFIENINTHIANCTREHKK